MITTIYFTVDMKFSRWAIHSYEKNTYPFILQSKWSNKTDYILNLITKYPMKNLPLNKDDKTIFINLVIMQPFLFIDEFLDGFLNQNYSRENIILCISQENTDKINDIVSSIKKLPYKLILFTNNKTNFVKQRVEALKWFYGSNAEYILFLNSSVIFNSPNTLRQWFLDFFC